MARQQRQPAPIRVQVRSDREYVFARAAIQTNGGPVWFEVKASKRAMEALCRQVAATEGIEVGSIWGTIKKAAKKLARVSAIRDVMKLAKKATDLPILGDLMPPSVRAAIRMAATATEAAAALRSGNPQLQAEARDVLGRARQAAAANPAVAQALDFATRLTQNAEARRVPPSLASAPLSAERPY